MTKTLYTRKSGGGFTLIEIMISFLLLTLIGGSILVIYSGIFAGTRKADVNIEPLNSLEVLSEIFRDKVAKNPNVSISKGAVFGDYIYQVDDATLNENPVIGSTSTIMLRRLTIHVYFYSPDRTGESREREYVSTFMVGE